MNLHLNEELFEDIIIATGDHYSIPYDIIRKDYYVTLFLKHFKEAVPGMVFKGGTSLSKCFHVIDRFSEDIDITVLGSEDERLSQKGRSKANKAVISLCEELGFDINSPKVPKSRAKLNTYRIKTGKTESSSLFRSDIIIELAFQTMAYPVIRKDMASIIFDYLTIQGAQSYIDSYKLQAFELRVQDISRTFIDKVFALCDYYLLDTPFEKSRHLYDLHMLLPLLEPIDSLGALVASVRSERKEYGGVRCPSSKEEVDINELLYRISESSYYQKDYNEVTYSLLYKKVSYGDAIASLIKISEQGIF